MTGLKHGTVVYIAKEQHNCMTSTVFWTKKVKTQQQQNKKANIKILAGAGNRTRDLPHRRVRSLKTIGTTERSI